ncbi:MAG: ATP-binding protein, partial [Bacteroidota bacterium]
GLPEGDVLALHEDARGQVWIGTTAGLARATVRDGHTAFESFSRADGLADDAVFAFLPDPDTPGALWIGGSDRLTHFAPEAGFTPLAAPRMLVGDGRGHLWTRDTHSLDRVALADLRALASGEASRVAVTSYGREVGLDGEGVYGVSPPAASVEGRLYFPTTQGVAVVDLDALGDALPPPPVAITRVEADTSVYHVPPERLGPGLNYLAIDYAGIDLTAPERVQYRYRLDGFDDDWHEVGAARQAIYTNLPPGAYVFRVEAMNHQGTWSETPATFAFEVAPRVTQTGWFRGLLALTLVGLGLALYAVRARGLRRQKGLLRETVRQRTEQLQREKERAEAARDDAREARATVEAQAERLRELDAAKSRLFANLSHEFRTPLALILAPLEAAMADAPDLQLAHDQASRLLDLVNQLLDLSTLDAGHLRLRRETTDLGALVTRTVAAFRPDADARGVALHVRAEPLAAEVDPAHVERIVTNLVANALAHTDRGGKVAVALDASPDAPEARVSVRDTGEGIPPEALPHLFDRFFQVERASRSAQAGTGIGLALAQELAALHGGRITVESQEGFGSTFTVALPLAPEAARDGGPGASAGQEESETANTPPAESPPRPPLPAGAGQGEGDEAPPEASGVGPDPAFPLSSRGPGSSELTPAHPGPPEARPAARPTLLLVEDHADMRGFLARTLADAWDVVPAASG